LIENTFSLAANLAMKHLSARDKALVEGLVTVYHELEQNKVESLDKLAQLSCPHTLIHEGEFYNK
jgi:hypothetical protein